MNRDLTGYPPSLELVWRGFPILSDPTKEVATAYGVVDEDQPFAARWTFYIGVDGRLLFVDKQVSPTNHGRSVVAKLADLGIPRRKQP